MIRLQNESGQKAATLVYQRLTTAPSLAIIWRRSSEKMSPGIRSSKVRWN